MHGFPTVAEVLDRARPSFDVIVVDCAAVVDALTLADGSDDVVRVR